MTADKLRAQRRFAQQRGFQKIFGGNLRGFNQYDFIEKLIFVWNFF